MFKKSRLVAALGIAALLLLLPTSAMANIGGAGPRLHTIDKEHPTVSNIGGAGPRSTLEEPTQEFVSIGGSERALANIGGAGPTANIGGAGPRMEQDSTQSLIHGNIGGAGPRSLTQWLLDLLAID